MIKPDELEVLLTEAELTDLIPAKRRNNFAYGLNQYFQELCGMGVFLSDIPFKHLRLRARKAIVNSYYRLYMVQMEK